MKPTALVWVDVQLPMWLVNAIQETAAICHVSPQEVALNCMIKGIQAAQAETTPQERAQVDAQIDAYRALAHLRLDLQA
jgi:hypothetical protein